MGPAAILAPVLISNEDDSPESGRERAALVHHALNGEEFLAFHDEILFTLNALGSELLILVEIPALNFGRNALPFQAAIVGLHDPE